MHRHEPGAESDLRGSAVDPGDVRIRNECDCAISRNERAEGIECPGAHVRARRREHDVVDVVHVGFRDLVVQPTPQLVERVKLRLFLRERPVAAGASLPGRSRIDLEQHGECAVADLISDRGCLHRAAAERDHCGIR